MSIAQRPWRARHRTIGRTAGERGRVAQPRVPEGRPRRARRRHADGARQRGARALLRQLGAPLLAARLRPRPDRHVPLRLPRVGHRARQKRSRCWRVPRRRQRRADAHRRPSATPRSRSLGPAADQPRRGPRRSGPGRRGPRRRTSSTAAPIMVSRYDLDGVTLAEMPDVVLSTILDGVERASAKGCERSDRARFARGSPSSTRRTSTIASRKHGRR